MTQERLAKSRMRLSTLFTSIIGLSVVLFAITLLTALSYPADVALHAAVASLGMTPKSVASPLLCDPIVSHSRPPAARQRTPPWQVVLNDTESNRTTLYVHVWASQTRRLGNQLFNYASLFGIAWRNNMIPLWPDARTHLRTAFNIRIPIDQRNAIITVSLRQFCKFCSLSVSSARSSAVAEKPRGVLCVVVHKKKLSYR